MSFPHPAHAVRPAALWRSVAMMGVTLVLLLSWFAVDPASHRWLHDNAGVADACAHEQSASTPDHGDDAACVVTQFLAGATDLLVLALLLWWFAPRVLAHGLVVSDPKLRRAVFARHAPSCGPPVA